MQQQKSMEELITEHLRIPIVDILEIINGKVCKSEYQVAAVSYLNGCIATLEKILFISVDEIDLIIKMQLGVDMENINDFSEKLMKEVSDL